MIKHECPVDIREIIRGDHNAVQHSVTKLSMGQVGARIWTKVQKAKPKEMLLVALRKCGRLGEKTTMVCTIHHDTNAAHLVRTCGILYPMPLARFCLQELEASSVLAANMWRSCGRVHWQL